MYLHLSAIPLTAPTAALLLHYNCTTAALQLHYCCTTATTVILQFSFPLKRKIWRQELLNVQFPPPIAFNKFSASLILVSCFDLNCLTIQFPVFISITFILLKRKATQYRSWGFQEFEASRFQDNYHMKVVRLSSPFTGLLCFPGNIPGTHFC